MSEQTLPEQIANRLRRDILRGELEPGTQVKERDHASAMGVSRTPMREAIRILAKEGLLLLRPARSPIVAEPSYESVAQNVEVMTALELLSARLACDRASDAEIEQIAALADRMAESYDTMDKLDLFELDMAFHRAITDAAKNPVLAEMHQALVARLWRARYLSATRKSARERVLRQHEGIVTGLRARDANKVTENVRAHLVHLMLNVKDFFSNAGDLSAKGRDNTDKSGS
ncbi:GntR family transcriptional regulator [Sagittula sp. NFXS13]|uniref:GntR family transcriptional regulator n=1 Tax=Sagittula sp. NFXS13 TaxID=2819095 RepID=UPI0032DF74CA